MSELPQIPTGIKFPDSKEMEPLQEKVQDLMHVFEKYSSETTHLESAYADLQARLKWTQEKLKDVSQELEIKSKQVISDERMRELGEMTASIVHEIRNPLGGIEGFASLLMRDLEGQPEKQKMVGCILEGTRTLNRLVSNVLHYARPIQLRFSIANLLPLILNLFELVKADSSFSSKIIYKLQTDLSDCFLLADEEMLKTAFLNLIVNAAQAMQGGGQLSVRIIKDSKFAKLWFKDTGVGISSENIEKIFSPFFTTKENGNGLGLSEVQKVIQAHGGVISAESVEGRGTTFIIQLPMTGR